MPPVENSATETVQTSDSNTSTDPVQNALNALSSLPGEEVKTDTEKPADVKKEEPPAKPNLDRITEVERERYKERKKQNEEKQRLLREIEELKKAQKVQPEKELTDDELLQQKIANLLGEEERPLTKKELEKIFADKEKEREEKENQQRQAGQISEAVSGHKVKITNHIKTNEAKHPLLSSGMGDADDVYEVINADFLQKAQDYDEEYAAAHIMPIEQATQLYENYLASQMKTMLKSKTTLGFLKGLISEIEGQPQKPSEPSTLSNDSFSNSAPSAGDESEEARVRRAINAMG